VRRLIRRIERASIAAHEFVCNTWFYLRRGHDIGTALSLARDTLPR
jgi:hypothetical protein